MPINFSQAKRLTSTIIAFLQLVGTEVKNIRYFGSQPWSFPHLLMNGFTVEYAGGKITSNPMKIEDTAWFTKETLPNLPSKISIARRLMD
ncbi:MAG: hypothetical protein ACPGJS_02860 [Flammeovirgaceae bacterium]